MRSAHLLLPRRHLALNKTSALPTDSLTPDFAQVTAAPRSKDLTPPGPSCKSMDCDRLRGFGQGFRGPSHHGAPSSPGCGSVG